MSTLAPVYTHEQVMAMLHTIKNGNIDPDIIQLQLAQIGGRNPVCEPDVADEENCDDPDLSSDDGASQSDLADKQVQFFISVLIVYTSSGHPKAKKVRRQYLDEILIAGYDHRRSMC